MEGTERLKVNKTKPSKYCTKCLPENQETSMLPTEMQQSEGNSKVYLQCLRLKKSTIYLTDDKM